MPSFIQISIVTTMYKQAAHVEEFYSRMSKTVKKISSEYEILFVNDGSPDDCVAIALSLFHQDQRVKVIDLSRNFGHHKAIMTGLAYARGRYVFLIDIDLEEPPELLGRFWETFHETSGTDVVYGVQERRRGGWFERVSGGIFYTLFNAMSDHSLSPNQVTARLMSRRFVDALIQFREQVVLFGGLSALAGFRQLPLNIDKSSSSPTTYGLKQRYALLMNAITSFSNKPLVFVFHFGSLFFVLALLYCLYLLFNKLFLGHPVEGWTALIASVWLVGGITIFFLGIVAVYMATLFVEVKARPYTIIRKIYDRDLETDLEVIKHRK